MKNVLDKNFDRVLWDTFKNKDTVFLWNSFNGEIEKCNLKMSILNKDGNEIYFECLDDDKKSLYLLTNLKQISFFIPEQSVFFYTTFKEVVAEKGFKVEYPKEFSFVERRKHGRVNLDKTFIIIPELKYGVRRQVFDLSIGGISCVLPRSERLNPEKGTKFINCTLEVELRKIAVSIECVASQAISRYKLDSLPYGGHKIAFRFIKMNLKDRMFLEDVVFRKMVEDKKLKAS